MFQFGGKRIGHIRTTLRVVKESDLHHEERIFAADRRGIGLTGVIYPFQRFTAVVEEHRRFMKLFNSYFIARKFLYNLLERINFFRPFDIILRPFHLRHVHDVHRHVTAKDFIGFLFAVASRFAHVHIGNTEKRTGAAETGADGSLNQRTHTFRQNLFACGNPELGTAAEPGNNTAGSDNDFIGYIQTERTEYFTALFLSFHQLGRTDAVNIGNHHIPESHPFRPVFL